MIMVQEKENPAAMLGRLGGKSRSKRKQEAARRNGRLGGRPRKPAVTASESSLNSRAIIREPSNISWVPCCRCQGVAPLFEGERALPQR